MGSSFSMCKRTNQNQKSTSPTQMRFFCDQCGDRLGHAKLNLCVQHSQMCFRCTGQQLKESSATAVYAVYKCHCGEDNEYDIHGDDLADMECVTCDCSLGRLNGTRDFECGECGAYNTLCDGQEIDDVDLCCNCGYVFGSGDREIECAACGEIFDLVDKEQRHDVDVCPHCGDCPHFGDDHNHCGRADSEETCSLSELDDTPPARVAVMTPRGDKVKAF